MSRMSNLGPGVSADLLGDHLQAQKHSTSDPVAGMAVVGIWMFELAEAYSDLLNSAGLKSDVEEE